MKLSQIEFTLIIATLVVLCGASYKMGQKSVQPVAMKCAELPTPAPSRIGKRIPTPEPARKRFTFGDNPKGYYIMGATYFHYDKGCTFDDGRKVDFQERVPECPRCVAGSKTLPKSRTKAIYVNQQLCTW